ncbi:MAG: DoxX family protein [Minisyncoccia bacterium]
MNFLSSLHNKSFALLLVRVALASVFIFHGWTKIQGMEGTIAFFGTLGFAPFWAYVVAWVEFIGGILMLAGVWVREVGVLFTVIMIVAIYAVHWGKGFNLAGGYEFQFVLLLSSLAMVFGGAGKYALFGHKNCSNCKDGTCTMCKGKDCGHCKM